MFDLDTENLLSYVRMELIHLGEIHVGDIACVRACFNAWERVRDADDKNEALDALVDLKEKFRELGEPLSDELDRACNRLSNATKGAG